MASKHSRSDSPSTPRKKQRKTHEAKYPKDVLVNHMIWNPEDVYGLAFSSCITEPEDVGWTVHWDDYVKAEEAKKPEIQSGKKRWRRTRYAGIKGLFLGLPQSGQNPYGNVTYKIPFKDFFEKFIASGEYKVYFLEVVEYDAKSTSRLLLTKTTIEQYSEYDWTKLGGPWHYADGKHKCSERIRKYGKYDEGSNNNFQFFFDMQEEDIETLMNMTRKEPAAHERANEDRDYMCYNRGPRGAKEHKCPFAWTKDETLKRMEQRQ